MLLPPPMDYGPMKVKYLTHESCCSGFDFPFIKYTGHGGAPHLRIYFLEQHDGVFLVDMVYLQQSYPLIQQSMGQNHHYPWVRVLEQHAALYTILYTILIGWVHSDCQLLQRFPSTYDW